MLDKYIATPPGRAWLKLDAFLSGNIGVVEELKKRQCSVDEIVEIMKTMPDEFAVPLRWFCDGIAYYELQIGIGGNEQRIPDAVHFIARALRERKLPTTFNFDKRTVFVVDLLASAAEAGYELMVEYLFENIRKDYTIHDAVNKAVVNNHLPIVRYLFERCPAPSSPDQYAQLLLTASALGYLSIVRYLIDEARHAIDIHVKNDAALYISAKEGHLHVVRYLLEQCREPADIHAGGDLALVSAIEMGRFEVVRYLLERPDDPADVHACGDVALNFAICSGDTRLVRYLLEEAPIRADFATIDSDDFLPDVLYRHEEMLEYLRDFWNRSSLPDRF